MASIVYPYSATFDADGTANLAQAQQVTLQTLDASFNLAYTGSAIFSAFTLEEADADIAADYVVKYDAVAGKAALKTALADATSGGDTLDVLLEAILKSEVEHDLKTMNLWNIAEAEELTDVNVPAEAMAESGATEMSAVIVSSDKNIIAAQIPYANFAAFDAAKDASGNGSLNNAIAAGDSITFHLIVNSDLKVTHVLSTTGPGFTAAGGVVGGFASSNPTGSAAADFDAPQKSYTVNLTITKGGS